MNKNISFLLVILLLISCGKKKKPEDNKYFPVLSFINSQVAHVDTSLYPIIKLVRKEGATDTTYLRREEFRAAARDFLELPDLADKKLAGHYTEERMFDETLNRVIITYLPQNDDLEIQRLDVVIAPGIDGEDKVKNFIIYTRITAGDSTIIKNLLWQVNESFQVVSTVQKNDRPDMITTCEVIWNRKE